MNPLVFAHRGFSARAPENTMAAFRLGWESGADGVECDVRLTADGEVVCIHDSNTGRVADESLAVAASPWERLRLLEAGGWKGARWKGERIPRLQDLLVAVPAAATVVVELKCGPEIVPPLLDVLKVAAVEPHRFIAIAFDADALVELKRARPELKAYWLSELSEEPDGSFSPSIAEIASVLDELGVDGFGGQSGRGISESLVATLKQKGYAVNVWTVDDPVEALRLRALGATSVTTNNPTRILDAFRA